MNSQDITSNYIFVSYAHQDSKFVKAEINKLSAEGKIFWFDNDIEVGSDWANSIGKKIEDAKSILYFESKAAAKSKNCQRELKHAKEHGKTIETVAVPVNKKKIIIPIAIIVVLAIAFFVLFKSIPNVLSLKLNQASSMVEDAGFSTMLAYDYSKEFDLGYVIDQDKEGLAIMGSDVLLTQSLGEESNLTTVPNTVGSYISDGIDMLTKAELLKFTITAGPLDDEFGNITFQSAPAGYKVNKNSRVDLIVATEDKPITFEYKNQSYTINPDEETVIDLTGDLVENANQELPNATVITLENPGQTLMISDRNFPADVIVTGESGMIQFNNCSFAGNIYNVNNSNAIVVMLLPGCDMNGDYIIRNKIKEAGVNDTMPKLISWQAVNVICDNCAGAAAIFGDADISFNGTNYSINDVEYYIVAEEPELVFEKYTNQEINFHYVGQWWEGGQRIIHTDGEFIQE